MKINKKVVEPKPNWHQIETRRLRESELQEQNRDKKKKKLKLLQRVGLLTGLLGVAYSLGYSNVSAKEQTSLKEPVKGQDTSLEETPNPLEDTWSRILQGLKFGEYYSNETVNQALQEVKPVVTQVSSNVYSVTKEAITEAGEVLNEMVGTFPTVQPNPINVPLKETQMPVLTRKLSPEELDDSNIEVSEKIEIPEKLNTQEPTPEPVIRGTSAATPLASVDVNPVFEGELENFNTFNSPFKYKEANQAMRSLDLNLADLFYPAPEKIKDFEALHTQKEILPLFPEEVMQWSELVVELTNKHNERYKDTPVKHINPNFILAIMSIESQGIDKAQSHMAAKGLMQITTPVAEIYGFNSQSIFEPRNNIITAISFFADLKETAVGLGLEGNEIDEYAVMFYNGGWNADKYFKTSRVEEVLKSKELAQKVFEVENMEGVKSALVFMRGNIYSPGYEFYTYGTRLTKKETLKYREKYSRFLVMAEIAQEIRSGLIKNGYSKTQADELTRNFIQTSSFIKTVNKNVRAGLNYPDYFEEKAAYTSYLTINSTLTLPAEYSNSEEINPAYYLMYR